MKSIISMSIVAICCLTGCSSRSWLLDDSVFPAYINKDCVTTRDLYLNDATGGIPYAFYACSLSEIASPSYEGTVVAKIPAGYQVRILHAGRERGGDGHVWDYLIGEIVISNSHDPVKFQYLVGLAGDLHKGIPFK